MNKRKSKRDLDKNIKLPTNSKNHERPSFRDRIKKLIICTMTKRKDTKEHVKRVTQTVVVLGHQKVGKTCIIKALCGCKYLPNYTPTVLDIYEKETMIGASFVKFEFIDFSGTYSFPAMRDLYIRKADIFFLVYDKTHDSFEELKRLKKHIEQMKRTHISELSVAVIKSKCDSTISLKSRREKEEEISRWCGMIFQCSAKNHTNINLIEDYLLSEGLFTDARSPSSPSPLSERNKASRLSGRYIYGGRKRTKSLILNRGPDTKS